MSNAQETAVKSKYGSPAGLLAVTALGFAFYFALPMIGGIQAIPDYNGVVESIDGSGMLYWFFMNFTEPNFFAGFASSILALVGAAAAWILAVKGSKYAGFEICYGSANAWPWVFASQIISLVLVLFVMRYTTLFGDGATWIPTFITLVNVPPALILIYGPSIPNLLTVSVLGAFLCTPVAFWLSGVFAPWNIPGVVSNVTAMAIAGIIGAAACHVLPWMEKATFKPVERPLSGNGDTRSAGWLVRRVVADFAEPLFYGNELVGGFMLFGVLLDTLLNPGFSAYGGGAKAVGAVVLSELVAGGVGVFLYAGRWEEKGWYATYVPVVSVAPACVLMFGATIPVALFSAVLGGVIGAPLAEHISGKMPSYVPGTVANVTSMAVCTVVVAVTMQALPWF